MDFDTEIKKKIKKEAYGAALKEDWDTMAACYKKNKQEILCQISLKEDSALHIAVYSQNCKPLQDLLDIAKEGPHMEMDMEERIPKMVNEIKLKNSYGNTPLHEAVMTGNFDAIKLLATRYPPLLYVKNSFGETPLFMAASFADTKFVEYLAKLPGQMVDANTGLLDIHRQKENHSSILHSALLGEHLETALLLLKLDKSLADLKDAMGQTALHILAGMPSAFRSGYPMGISKKLFYFCLPIEDSDDEHNVKQDTGGHSRRWEDLESGQGRNQTSLISYLNVCKGWPLVEEIWNDKKKHEQALRIAKLLIKDDFSWNVVDKRGYRKRDATNVLEQSRGYGQRDATNVKEQGSKLETPFFIDATNVQEQGRGYGKRDATNVKEQGSKLETPLFIATRNGIVEIIQETLEEHPQAIEHLNVDGQNILHLAVLYRREEIFHLVKKMRVPFKRLCRKTDNKGYNLLHQVADITHYTGGTKPGPALQLQEELIWFERVKKEIPTPYAALGDWVENKTAEELFKKRHKPQLKEAQEWIKGTSSSCSTVAVLVATVVFAAAYTVPGGSNAKGIPNFLHYTFFKFFTIMDVIALACSLTSVVIFLSALTSSFELKDFYQSLSRRLMLGFTMLFLSLMTTMLAFGATILLMIRLEKTWTTSLISIAAFLPVAVFALFQFDLYVAFLDGLKDFLKGTMKALPVYLVPSFWWKKKLH